MAVSFYIFSTSIHIDSEKVQNAIAFISSRTMNIYLIHFLFTSLFSKIVTALSIKENLAMHFIRTLAILILSIIVTEPLTYIPGINMIMTNGNKRRIKGNG